MASVSFHDDIRPIFGKWKGQMIWRFDLTDYDVVKANAQLILGRISSKDSPMPPPPYSPLTADQIQQFEDWIAQGYPA